MVRRDADIEVVRQEVRLCFGDDAVDLVGSNDQVFSGALSHVEGHHRVAPFAGEAGGFLIDELNGCHIPQVDGVAPFGLDDDGLELCGIAKVADHLDRAAAAVHEDVTTGNGHVLLSNGLGNVIEADEHGLGAEVVDFDLHLLLVDPADLGLIDLVEVLDAVLQFFCVVLELVDGVVAREVHLHHGDELGEVEVEDVGVAGEVVGEAGVAHGDVHFVLHLPERDFRGHGEIELDVDRAVALLARGEDDVDAGDALQLLFNGARDELLDVARAVAGIGGADVDLRHGHLREAFLGHGDVAGDAGDEDDRDEHADRGPIADGGRAQPEFLEFL